MGQLIIIEGGDGSGKATQTAKLLERLKAEGYPVRSVSFPNYDSQQQNQLKCTCEETLEKRQTQ